MARIKHKNGKTLVHHLGRVTAFALLFVTMMTAPSWAEPVKFGDMLVAATGAEAPKGKFIVKDLRVGLNAKKTRFVLDVSASAGFRVFTLANPYRVVVDLPESGWQLPQKPLPSNRGVVKQIRYGLFKPGTSRVVIDVKGPVVVDKAFALPPSGSNANRLVIDLKPVTVGVFAAKKKDGVVTVAALSGTAGPATVGMMPLKRPGVNPPAKPNAVAAPVAPTLTIAPVPVPLPGERRGPKIVALDPGHGGVDPGAIGKRGTYEKHITLAMGRELKARLEATGRYKVFMTRERDIFIRLRDRIQMARDANADLFISIHADSVRNPKVRGLSVYTLSERASDKEAALLAEKENKADLIAGIDLSTEAPEVTNILIDLAQRETMNQSSKLADDMVDALKKEVRLLRNTHRFAGFAVLKAPDVPSVLLELGFLSHKEEERMLRKKSYRDKLGRAIVKGIDQYFQRVEEAQSR